MAAHYSPAKRHARHIAEQSYTAELYADAPDRRHNLDASSLVVLSDLQIPFEDPAAVRQALRVIDRVQPDTVILNGDVVDFYEMSDFSRDPVRYVGTYWPQTIGRFEMLMKALAGIPVVWLWGNHEQRVQRHMWTYYERHRELPSIAVSLLTAAGVDPKAMVDPGEYMRTLFHVSEYPNLTVYETGHRVYVAERNLIVTHGRFASRHSGWSARRQFEEFGTSVIVGHSHRLGSYLVTQDGQPRGAWENGCLCHLEPEYLRSRGADANWQQGFSVVKVDGPEFHVIQVPIVRRGKNLVAVYHE